MDKQILNAKQEHGEDTQKLSYKTEQIPENPASSDWMWNREERAAEIQITLVQAKNSGRN